ncbi:MAG: LCP family protein [Actinobacteria bacterium]|nr:LCP family protein [Actinomycetota bacterium]
MSRTGGPRGCQRDPAWRPRRRLPWAIASALVLCLATGALTVGLHPPGATDRAFAAADAIELRAAHGASFVPALDGSGPLFILALGSDARPGQVVARQRADSIHLIGVNPARHRATILGIPRDSFVAVPGFGSRKINNAMVLGGPELMVRTVEALTGVRIDFYLLTSFKGLERMVDAVGGLTVDVPYAMDDSFSHVHLRAGPQRLRGWQALALARNRHDTPNGDFSRSLNQGRLLLSALAQLRREFEESPGRLLSWLVIGWRNIKTDLDFDTILELGMTATQVPATAVNNLVVSGSSGFVGGASVVFLSPGGGGVYADMRNDGLAG